MSDTASFTPLTARAARSAYTAYILHPLFVVPLTAAIAAVVPGTLLRFAVLCLLAVLFDLRGVGPGPPRARTVAHPVAPPGTSSPAAPPSLSDSGRGSRRLPER